MTRHLPHCLCCDGDLLPLVDFGEMPLANTYSVKERFPLRVNRCVDCCHLQLNESVNPAILFSDYVYCSGTSETALRFFEEFAWMTREYLSGAREVLDIACNDGTQLDAFKRMGMATVGVDPAENLCDVATARGHEVICGLFEEVEFHAFHKFDIITAQNVLAHTPQPLAFLRKCRDVMAEHTRLFVTASQADMIAQGQCDTIYHEHISYFNLRSMERLAERAGLKLLDVRMNPIHGTSYVFVLGVNGERRPAVDARMLFEYEAGLYESATYHAWRDQVARKIASIRLRIGELRSAGYRLVGCGAAAKGITILNMAGVKLDCLVDTTPSKWNRKASGMVIWPFEHIAEMRDEKIAFIVLAWNFEEEVVRNVRRLRDNPNDVFETTK